MVTEKLDNQIKVRVPAEVKKAFEQLASMRHLDVADVVREALRDFLGNQNGNGNHAEKPSNQKELGL